MAEQEEHQYHPKDAIGETIRATLATGGAGLFVSSIQNTLKKQNVGALGVFTRTGGTIAAFAGIGGAYAFAKTASANLRQKDDSWNNAIGGFFGGSVLGLGSRSLAASLGYGAGFAVILAAFNYTGGRFMGTRLDDGVDEVSRKEYMRKNRRRPIEETINELGEGRGIYGPGYEQRRAERIKERYGIDVPVQSTA
ncbi:uncharacterized protein MYCFIDRAFT_33688 [Pseudocercospora fijiensis CIRAD86]|uniref:NADH-ubiquinone oxidoreductase 213 kDa subunit n=1 Tax=Pseudocercospora fijiensis (strain CIRAD86) TaxID=383855 RepID=M3ALD2_PSEFD|nr:uncharacterized protein MYCFIDRAFT_33688 [Pseudocercospora fijiensis CIRAD86]EME77968.1 hypothetical protein MYCFIDRAFT_33688 [Pseudocercospora fijiensis CIRAD86]